ncbi:MAG: hypothetical protein DHS20C20_06820 [Ardenticatenaceae bacterium]|nr:MAG: hypothetical protein DHS20C20_06820 [Ardenticatenaceae bacterium]
MSLEDRVKELEEELKVLKNEIRATLLDIEEQVLVHYYPSLYPSVNEETRPKLNQQPDPPQQTVNQPAMFSAIPVPPDYFAKYNPQTVTLPEEPEDELPDIEDPLLGFNDEERPSPIPETKIKQNGNGRKPENNQLSADDNAFLDKLMAVESTPSKRKITFEEIKNRTAKPKLLNENTPANVTEALVDEMLQESPINHVEEFPSTLLNVFDSQTPQSKPNLIDSQVNRKAVRLTVRKLLTWVDKSVATIGKDNTNKAIEMYIRAGDLSREMRHALLRLVHSSQSPQPTKVAGIRQVIDTLGQLNDILDHHSPEYLNEVLAFISEVSFG